MPEKRFFNSESLRTDEIVGVCIVMGLNGHLGDDTTRNRVIRIVSRLL